MAGPGWEHALRSNADYRACAAKWAIRPDTLRTCSAGVCAGTVGTVCQKKAGSAQSWLLCRKTIIHFPRWTHVWILILDAGWLLLTKHELRLHIPTRFVLVLIRSSLVMQLRSMQSGARGIQAVKNNAKHKSRFFFAFSGGGRQKIEPHGAEGLKNPRTQKSTMLWPFASSRIFNANTTQACKHNFR